jgi:hypothetical protein
MGMGDIYPECEHTPPCYNGVGACYSNSYARHELDKQRGLGPVDPADRIADDADKIYELIQATGVSLDEYTVMRNVTEASMKPRTHETKPDDLGRWVNPWGVHMDPWSCLCEVEGCDEPAYPCPCGSAHCVVHPGPGRFHRKAP